MNQEYINDFMLLFNIVLTKNENILLPDAHKQAYWNGVIAGRVTSNTRFILTAEVSAVLDIQNNDLRFSQGSGEKLARVLRTIQPPPQATSKPKATPAPQF